MRTDADAAVTRIEAAVDDLDLTVKQIRSAIFELESSGSRHVTVCATVLALAREATGALGFEPRASSTVRSTAVSTTTSPPTCSPPCAKR